MDNWHLLDNRWAPPTLSLGFINETLEIVSDKFSSWSLRTFRLPRREEIAGSLEEKMLHLAPLDSESSKALFVSVGDKWTAYFDNGVKESQAETVVGQLCEFLEVPGVCLCNIPSTIDPERPQLPGMYGALKFVLFGSNRTHHLNVLRYLSLTEDFNGWTFEMHGQIQRFEEQERYKRRNRRERLTTGMLQRYSGALGLRAFDPAFYEARGVVVDAKVPFVKPRCVMSFREAQASLGLDRAK